MKEKREQKRFRKCIHNKIEEICNTLSEITVEASEIIKECKKDQELKNGGKSDERETGLTGSKTRVS